MLLKEFEKTFSERYSYILDGNVCYTSYPIETMIEKSNNLSEEITISNINELFNDDISITKEDMENKVKEEIMNGNLDQLINELDNNTNEVLIIENKNEKSKLEITTTKNNNEFKNISIIKLGECENLLKKKYNIDKDEPLIIFKIDIYKEGLLTPII